MRSRTSQTAAHGRQRRTQRTGRMRLRCRALAGWERLEDRALLAAGDIDTDFGVSGQALADFGGIDFPSAVTLHSDGRAVVVGQSLKFDPDSTSFALARFLADGSLDLSFGNGGLAETVFATANSAPEDIAIQADGKYVVVGSTTGTDDSDFVILRYMADGQLDATFGTNGIRTFNFGSNDGARSVAVDAAGRIVVAGYSGNRIAMVRYLSSGNLDDGFGVGGRVMTELGAGASGAESLAIAEDGRIFVGTQLNTASGRHFALVRYQGNGTLDSSFDDDGWVSTDVSAGDDRLQSIDIQPDGRIVAAGYSTGVEEAFVVARYNTDGSLDSSFGAGGIVVSDLTGGPDRASTVQITAQDQIIVAGVADGPMSDDYAIVRYQSDGQLDPTFGSAGVAIHDFGQVEDVQDMGLRADGRILVVGQRSALGNTNFALAQFIGDAALEADRFEPNNSAIEATQLEGSSQQVTGLNLHVTTDRDFFRWEAATQGVLLVTVESNATTGDLDLAVLDAQGGLLAESRTAGNRERVSLPVTAGTIHYLRIEGYADALLEYDLSTILLPDTDGDGLPDVWEQQGVDIDFDDVPDYELPGADPLHKDLFLEIDAMEGRAPLPLATPLADVEQAGLATGTIIDRVIREFLRAPVDNPDGSPGIRLHVNIDETNLPRTTFQQWSDFAALRGGGNGSSGHFGTPTERQSPNWSQNAAAAKGAVYRYGVFADRIRDTRISGIAETPGTTFAITLGGWDVPGGTADEQAGTLMHELGHTLGLHHGGGDDVNFKPNYFSVMNYHWQVPRAANSGWSLMFSNGTRPTLNEASLNESQGIGFAPGDPLATNSVVVGPLPLAARPLAGPVDWNRNGQIDTQPVAADINRGYADTNRDGFVNELDETHGELLHDHDDWSGLRFIFTGPADLRKYRDGVDVFPWEVEEDPNDLYDNDPPDWFDLDGRRNDDRSSAYPLNQFDGFTLIAEDSGKLDGVTLHDAQDVDWFEVSARVSGTMQLLITTVVDVGNPLIINVTDEAGRLISSARHVPGDSPTPVRFEAELDESYLVNVSGEDAGSQSVYQLDFQLRPSVRSLADLERLCQAIHAPGASYDVDGDGATGQSDLQLAVNFLLLTSAGDANLDRIFNSTDLVLVLQAGEYEDALARNSNWSTGDWNCDGEFTSTDLVTALQTGTYETAATAATAEWLPSRRRAAAADVVFAIAADALPIGESTEPTRLADLASTAGAAHPPFAYRLRATHPAHRLAGRFSTLFEESGQVLSSRRAGLESSGDSESDIRVDGGGLTVIARGGPDEAGG